MSLNDPLANVLSRITQLDNQGKKDLLTQYNSKVIKKILDLLRDEGYIGEFSEIVDSKGNKLLINLIGAVNKAGVIKPNFQIGVDKLEYYEKRYLPARDLGIMIISTNKGIITHRKAKELNIGGKLLAYCY